MARRRNKSAKVPAAATHRSERPESLYPSRPAYAAIVLAGLAGAALVWLRVPGVNGPWYWPWRYVDLPALLFLALCAACWALLYAASGWAANAPAWRRALPAVLVHGALIFGFTALSPDGFPGLQERVAHPDITSYHTEALRIDDVGAWLGEYPQRLRGMVGHTQTHPPGPVLYYHLCNRLLGPAAGALWGGLLLGVIAMAAPLLAALVTLRLTGRARDGQAAALAWAPLPAITLMLGAFDAAYPALTFALLLLWLRACWDSDARAAVGFGCVLFAALMLSHGFLVLGSTFLLLGVGRALFGADRHSELQRFGRAALVTAATLTALFGLAWAASGYNHYAALAESMRIQDGLAAVWNRPWTSTVVWDLFDFCFAAGWTPALVLAVWLLRGRTSASAELKAFALASLATLAVVDLSGLLRAEVARVWLFLQPLIYPLVGVELASWSEGRRYGLLALMLLVTAVFAARISFL